MGRDDGGGDLRVDRHRDRLGDPRLVESGYHDRLQAGHDDRRQTHHHDNGLQAGDDDRLHADGHQLIGVVEFAPVLRDVFVKLDGHHLQPALDGEQRAVVMQTLAPPTPEAVESFPCFGGRCVVLVQGSGPAGDPPSAAARVRHRLLDWHAQFSRFEPESELSRLNRDPREAVAVSATMTRFVEAAIAAADLTEGLVDPTLVREVEAAGYARHYAAAPLAAVEMEHLAPPSRPASAHPDARWRQVTVDRRRGIVARPVGLELDSGGIAKGLFGDILASLLAWHESFAIEAAGDVRVGGASGVARPVLITDPFDAGEALHTFELARGAVATSGISHRSWIGGDGRAAHHLLDPASGRPAFTGIVQASAVAPTGVEAEARAKAALLSGPDAARRWLPHGGVIVYDDGTHDVVEPPLPGTGR